MNYKTPIELKLKRIESSRSTAWDLLEVMERTTTYNDIKECIFKTKATMQNTLFDNNHFSKDKLEEMKTDVCNEIKSILSLYDATSEYFLLKAVLEYIVKIISDSKFVLKYHQKACREYLNNQKAYREYLNNKHKLNL